MASIKTFIILAFVMAGLSLQDYVSDAAKCVLVSPANQTSCNALTNSNTACCYLNSNVTETQGTVCVPIYNNDGNRTALNTSAITAGTYYTCGSSIVSVSAILSIIASAFLF